MLTSGTVDFHLFAYYFITPYIILCVLSVVCEVGTNRRVPHLTRVEGLWWLIVIHDSQLGERQREQEEGGREKERKRKEKGRKRGRGREKRERERERRKRRGKRKEGEGKGERKKEREKGELQTKVRCDNFQAKREEEEGGERVLLLLGVIV